MFSSRVTEQRKFSSCAYCPLLKFLVAPFIALPAWLCNNAAVYLEQHKRVLGTWLFPPRPEKK